MQAHTTSAAAAFTTAFSPLALAAAIALSAAAPAGAATNNWRCAGGAWNGDTACWSLNSTPIASHDIRMDASDSSSQLLMTLVGGSVTANSFGFGGARSAPTFVSTANFYVSGATLATAGNMGIGVNDNSNASVSLNNNTTLTVAGGVQIGNRSTSSGTVNAGLQPGVGYLSMQGATPRINGSVGLVNGGFDMYGGTVAGSVVLGNHFVAAGGNSTANIAGHVRDGVFVLSGTANIGATQAELATPVIGAVGVNGAGGGNAPAIVNFVGRSSIGYITVNAGETATFKAGSNVLVGSNVVNSGFVRGNGRIEGPGSFIQQAGSSFIAEGGDLTLTSRFDGSAGGQIAVGSGGRLFLYGDARVQAGQVITNTSSIGPQVVFGAKLEIGSDGQRGGLSATSGIIALQGGSHLMLDFGGDTDHDFLATTGSVILEGGRLTLSSAGSFVAGIGSSFNILRAGQSRFGTFGSIDSSGFALAPGATLDYSNLYTNGSFSVTAVPEPATWLTLAAGLMLMGAYTRRRAA